MKFTIFGPRGFIGSSLAAFLQNQGCEVFTPARDEQIPAGMHLGHVVYAIGLTGNFRSRPFDTIEAHVSKLTELMRCSKFDSWLYLASTRIYGDNSNNQNTHETSPVCLTPSSDSLYDISKLLGEAWCLGHENPNVRAVRLSNVFGIGQSLQTFLGAVIDELLMTGTVTIREAPQAAKDYIHIQDVLDLILKIVLSGRHRLYNLASGVSTSHGELANMLEQATGNTVRFAENAPVRKFPQINIERIKQEFQFQPRLILNEAQNLVSKWPP